MGTASQPSSSAPGPHVDGLLSPQPGTHTRKKRPPQQPGALHVRAARHRDFTQQPVVVQPHWATGAEPAGSLQSAAATHLSSRRQHAHKQSRLGSG